MSDITQRAQFIPHAGMAGDCYPQPRPPKRSRAGYTNAKIGPKLEPELTERQWLKMAIRGTKLYIKALLKYRARHAPRPVCRKHHHSVVESAALEAVVARVAYDTGWTVAQLKSPKRTAAMVNARALVAIEARHLGFSYPAIGRALNRDHSSIVHLVQTRG